jgi:hypothetical protein
MFKTLCFLAAILTGESMAQTRKLDADLESANQQVAESIEAFRKTSDVADLRKAADNVDRIFVRTYRPPDERRHARTAKLGLWLTVLDALDSAEDPKWNPADVPAARISIPDTPMKPGVPVRSAEGIADPEVRRKYDQAVAANAEKTRRYRLQKELRQLDAILTRRADAYITAEYPKSPESLVEMDKTVARYLNNPVRAEHVRALVVPLPR